MADRAGVREDQQVMDLQFFIPSPAYVFQVGVFLVGWLGISSRLGSQHRVLAIGLAFPLGFAVVAFCQWGLFVLGIADAAPLAIALVFGLLLLERTRSIRTSRMIRIEAPWRALTCSLRWPTALATLVLVGSITAAWLVAESSGLSEPDPRWQWGLRAKILATQAGYQCDWFQNPSIWHLNPRYPLLYSAYEAVMLRAAHSVDDVNGFRTLPLFFFFSHLFMLWGMLKKNDSRLAFCAATGAMVLMGRFWSLAIDETNVDYPLGVCALAVVCLTHIGSHAKWRGPMLALSSATVVVMKCEGTIILAACMLAGLVILCRRHECHQYRKVLGIAFTGAVCAWILYGCGLRQISPALVMENVTPADASFTTLIHNASRWPAIGMMFVRQGLSISDLGFLMPLALLSLPLQSMPAGRHALFSALLYLALMTFPFVVSPFAGGNFSLHVQLVVPRLYIQVLPLLSLALLSCGEEVRTIWRSAACREAQYALHRNHR